jgi:hypothetical protein
VPTKHTTVSYASNEKNGGVEHRVSLPHREKFVKPKKGQSNVIVALALLYLDQPTESYFTGSTGVAPSP